MLFCGQDCKLVWDVERVRLLLRPRVQEGIAYYLLLLLRTSLGCDGAVLLPVMDEATVTEIVHYHLGLVKDCK